MFKKDLVRLRIDSEPKYPPILTSMTVGQGPVWLNHFELEQQVSS